MRNASTDAAVEEAVSADDVLRAHFTLKSIDGAIECIDLDGAEGWTSPNSHPALSLMRFNHSDKRRAAEALDKVLQRFDTEGRCLEWMTGPGCVSAGHISLLISRGFDPEPMQVAAMSLDLNHVEPINKSDGVETFLVDGPGRDDMGVIMARGFSVPDEVGMIYHRAYLARTELQTSDVYAATLAGSDEIIGVGYLTYLADGTNAFLRASSVLEAARGNGAYRALVRHRLIDAAARGCREVFVHAYSKPSRECLSNLGFRTLGGLSLFRWSPSK